MLETISLAEPLSDQTSNQLFYESQINRLFIDCYPYAAQGIVFGLLLSITFWGSAIGLLWLVF